MVLLIHPPVVKPSEPPAGIAALAGALQTHGVKCRLLDLNIEGLLSLFGNPFLPSDPWSRRACRNLSRNLLALKTWHTYGNIDRYHRASIDLNHLLGMADVNKRAQISFTDYHQPSLSPVRSSDLLHAAECPEENPFFPYFRNRLSILLSSESTSVVGLSLNYLSQALCAFALVGFLRREFPGITLVLGGSLVTSWMKSPHWHNPFGGLVDHLIAGPGESPLLDLLGKKASSEVLSPPRYDDLPMADYLAPGPILPYRSAIGCYWGKCSFCPEKAEGTRHIPMSLNRVVADLATLTETKKPSLLHLVDSAINPALMKIISKNPPGVSWYGFSRISKHLTDLDFCKGLKTSGCVMLKLGLESGDQGVLDDLQKGNNIEAASLALRTLKQAGIATYVYLLFGTPAETIIEARRTLDFTARHSDEIDFLNVALFNLPLNSPEAASLETKRFYDGDLSLYADFSHPRGWNRRIVRQFLEGEFKRHPAIRSILRRHPRFFGSNHAPFFVMRDPSPIEPHSSRAGA